MVSIFKKLLSSVKFFFVSRLLLRNIFNTNFKKNVLVSYTLYPFLSSSIAHSNAQELKAIACIFKELGYNVDIVHYTNRRSLIYQKYDCIFGFGEPLENSFAHGSIKRICYATGACACFQNVAEIRRVMDVNRRYNSNIMPKRIVSANWAMSFSMSDALIVIGNDWTKSTFSHCRDDKIHAINATALQNKDCIFIKRNFEDAGKNFLWFGSSGFVHKGLDLCLECFKDRPDLTLHVCGIMEDDFDKVFGRFLSQKNIINYGFVNVSAKKYIDIVKKCFFSVFPTCSEGQSTSLLTTMSCGIIPITTKFSGIDVDKLGVLINKLTVDDVNKSIDYALSMEKNEIKKLSKLAGETVRRYHTVSYFKRSLKNIITSELNDKI